MSEDNILGGEAAYIPDKEQGAAATRPLPKAFISSVAAARAPAPDPSQVNCITCLSALDIEELGDRPALPDGFKHIPRPKHVDRLPEGFDHYGIWRLTNG